MGLDSHGENKVESSSLFGVRLEKRGGITGFNFGIPEWQTNVIHLPGCFLINFFSLQTSKIELPI